MEIIELKKLQNLFSWAQFYQNSEQLAVSRYPRQYRYVNGGQKYMIVPDGDKKRYDKVQEEILKIGNKN